jgi:protein-disulfide isomerase
MRPNSNVLLVSASALLFSAAALTLYLQAPHCKRLNSAKTKQLIGYVRERYKIAGDVGVSLVEDHLLNDSCTREVALSSATWRGQRSFFLSSDQNYLLTSAADLRSKPQIADTNQEAPTLAFAPLANTPAPTSGEQNAPATLVEFSDFECPFCSKFAHVVASDLTESERKKIKVEFHFFPLPFHPWAERAAEDAYCVSQQSQPSFWKLHDYLFENQKGITEQTIDARIVTFLKTDKDIDLKAFQACSQSSGAREAVAADVALGKKYGVSGTPTSFLNGQKIVGAQGADSLTKDLDSAILHPSATVTVANVQSKSNNGEL